MCYDWSLQAITSKLQAAASSGTDAIHLNRCQASILGRWETEYSTADYTFDKADDLNVMDLTHFLKIMEFTRHLKSSTRILESKF